MSKENIIARYWIETGASLEAAAAQLAGEQSSGTFIKLPGESDALKSRHAAEVLKIEELEGTDTPSLPGAVRPEDGNYRRAEVTVSFPMENVGTSLVNLQTMLAGNLFELHSFSGLRLLDFEVPESFLAGCPGPAFGVEGTRRVTGVQGRPLIGTIIKPSVGLSPEETGEACRTMAEVGIDFIKDDELIADPPYSRLEDRVRHVMGAIRDVGVKDKDDILYAANISGSTEEMKRHHDTVKKHGGNCVMVNLIATGLSGLLELRRFCELPIHGHRNGWGAMSRYPALGFSYPAWQKFWKLAGVDHLHVNGLRNKFCEPDESVIRSAKSVQGKIHGAYAGMPVFSSGQWVDQVEDTWLSMGNADLMYVCGGGIWAHPMGGGEGVRVLKDAWTHVMAGKTMRQLREADPAIEAAYSVMGKGR